MTPEQIAAMVADREAGTPGPWVSDAMFCHYGHAIRIAFPDRYGVPSETIAECHQNWNDAERTDQRISWKQAEANARRIASVPDMEATIIAQAAELATLRAERDELQAALDSIEIGHGITSNGNLWRFWANKARELALKGGV